VTAARSGTGLELPDRLAAAEMLVQASRQAPRKRRRLPIMAGSRCYGRNVSRLRFGSHRAGLQTQLSHFSHAYLWDGGLVRGTHVTAFDGIDVGEYAQLITGRVVWTRVIIARPYPFAFGILGAARFE
jgi:hypothetical protein